MSNSVLTSPIIEGSFIEVARLLNQVNYLSSVMGGPLPEQESLPSTPQMLDLFCGTGGWTIEIARAYPQGTVIGIDTDSTMIGLSELLQHVYEQKNVQFSLDDPLHPHLLSEASFDLIHGFLLTQRLPRGYWSSLLRVIQKFLRPGGVLRLLECSRPETQSPAIDAYLDLYVHALRKIGRSYRGEGQDHLSIPQFFSQQFSSAGYHTIQSRHWLIDIAPGSPEQKAILQEFRLAFQFLRSFLASTLTRQEEVEALYAQAVEDLRQDRFCARWEWFLTWAKKP